MGLITKVTANKWHNRNKNYYVEKGYEFTKYGDEFEVRVEDLTIGSHVEVDVQCDGCEKEIKNVIWKNYKRNVKENGKYYCQKCSNNGYEKWVSFYDWCYDNLSKEETDNILSRWDYNLNVKNGKVLSPKDVSYSSNGFDKKGYWFKCLDYSEHESELKNISNFISGQKGSIRCIQCNMVAITNPEIAIFFSNKEDAYNYSKGSNKKVLMKCPDCGYEKLMRILDLFRDGFSCVRCNDGKSFPEKFMFNVLEQLNMYFQTQLSKNTFEWCDKYKYDFYISNFNIIIETHGEQHYKENNKSKWKYTLKEVQENDIQKEQLAKNNNIDHYIILDCRESNLEWIKNSIMKSELPKLLNFTEDDIDWLKCHEAGCNSLVKKICNLWNSDNSITKIMKELKISRTAVRRYLRQGVKLSWCDYSEKASKNNCKQVICLTTREIFDSIKQAKIKYNITSNSVCCKGKQKSAGKLPDGTKLVWMYYDEYINNYKG